MTVAAGEAFVCAITCTLTILEFPAQEKPCKLCMMYCMGQVQVESCFVLLPACSRRNFRCCIARHPCLLECFSIRLGMRTHEISAKHTLKTILQKMILSRADDSHPEWFVLAVAANAGKEHPDCSRTAHLPQGTELSTSFSDCVQQLWCDYDRYGQAL